MVFALAAGPADAQTAPQAPPTAAPKITLADASGDSAKVEEVVVTARHRAEKAQTVPIAITSVSGKKLSADGINSFDQLQLVVPSLQITQFNPRNTSFNIRGIGNNIASANDGLESGVGVYVDGVFYARPAQATFEFPGIDNVQVLRGPQGTLFGKNTTAGAIDVHTTPPSFTPGATLEASVGNYNYWQTKGTATGGLSEKVAGSVSFLLGQRTGTETSISTGAHYGNQDDKAVRAQLLVLASDDLTFRLIGDYSHELDNCCVYFPVGIFTKLTNGTSFPYNFLQREAFTGTYVDVYNPFGRDAAIARPTYYNMETAGFSAQADYNWNGLTLTSISAWRLWNWYPLNGAIDALQQDVIHDSNQTDYQRQVSQELRVTSPTGGRFDYTFGGYFFYQDLPGALRTSFGPDAGPYLVGPKLPKALSILAFNGLSVYGRTNPVTNSYASYGQSTYHILPGLDFTGGLRFTYEDKSGSYDQTQFGAASPDGLSPALQKSLQAIRNGQGAPLYYNDHTHNGALSYLATLSYKVTPDIFTYATYSRGNKSGGINVTNLPENANGTLAVNPIVKPERVDNYEVGVKTTLLGGAVTANASAFWIEDSNYQGIAVSPLGNGTFTSYISSVPTVESRGAEVDTAAHPFPWLTLNLSGSYDDAIYEKYPSGQCPPEVSGAAAKICNLTGKNVPGTSRWEMAVGGEITQHIGSYRRYDFEGYVGADYSLRSNFNVSSNDSIYAQIPGYGLLDVRLGARTTDGKYDLYLWSRNATNTDYYKVLAAAAPFSGLIYGIPGDPVTFGATLKIKL